LGLISDILLDDSQLRNVNHDPVSAGIYLWYAAASLRVFREALPIIDETPDIEFIPQNDVAATPISIDSAGIPGAAARPGDLLRI
jgi:hypothetical protein